MSYREKLNEVFLVQDASGEYNENKDFVSLEAWKNAKKVKLFFYKKIIPTLPNEEFNLNVQMRKASISVTANIAEGYGRFHYQELLQFFRIARGSLYELKDHLISCNDLSYIEADLLKEGNQLIEASKKNINGYVNYIKKRIKDSGRNKTR